MTTTTNLGLTLPTPNVDTGWGSTLNNDFTLIDNLFAADGSGTSVGLNVGSGKTINVGGTLVAGGTVILGAGDGTTSTTAPTIRGAARTGTNAAGANLTIDAPNGTGTGGSGKFVVRTAPAGSTGSTANTLRSAFEVNAAGAIGVNDAAYGTANQVLVSGGSAAAATWGNVDGSVISIPSQAQGDIMYRGASSWTRLPAGTSGQVLRTNGAAADPSWGTTITRGTAISTTGNYFFDFTSIPAGVTRITVMLTGVGMTSGGYLPIIQIGDSGGIETTGYQSGAAVDVSTNYFTSNTTGFVLAYPANSQSSSGYCGAVVLHNITGNTWVASGTIYDQGYTVGAFLAGTKTLSGVLDRVRLTSTYGAGLNFDTGTINILYE